MKVKKILVLFFAICSLCISAQTTNVGKINNSGACSFTAIDVHNSTYQIHCGSKGLLPSEAKQLSQVLTLIKRNTLQFDQVMDVLAKLAARQTVIQPNCLGIFCNGGAVEAPQTAIDNRMYGARLPAPAVRSEMHSIPALSPPVRTSEMTNEKWQLMLSSYQTALQVKEYADHPGVTLTITVAEPFANPQFVVSCSRPCIPTEMSINRNGKWMSISGALSRNRVLPSSDQRHGLFILGDEPVLMPGQAVQLTVRSHDLDDIGAASVTGYVQ